MKIMDEKWCWQRSIDAKRNTQNRMSNPKSYEVVARTKANAQMWTGWDVVKWNKKKDIGIVITGFRVFFSLSVSLSLSLSFWFSSSIPMYSCNFKYLWLFFLMKQYECHISFACPDFLYTFLSLSVSWCCAIPLQEYFSKILLFGQFLICSPWISSHHWVQCWKLCHQSNFDHFPLHQYKCSQTRSIKCNVNSNPSEKERARGKEKESWMKKTMKQNASKFYMEMHKWMAKRNCKNGIFYLLTQNLSDSRSDTNASHFFARMLQINSFFSRNFPFFFFSFTYARRSKPTEHIHLANHLVTVA